ncbi:MAG: thymidine phosphorylase [Candidatus Pacearchaeota archaeon]|nr:MAG: thymidine phosphorylase [Candidatus Pacearchaeota archaeon]
MELRIKFLKWSAGIPVAMINSKTASKIGVHPLDRITIKSKHKKSKEVSSVVDITETLVKKNEIGISHELKSYLNFKNNEKVEVNLSNSPYALNFIKKKLNNKALTQKELDEIMEDIVNNSLSEAEIALFITAVYKNGMSLNEITYLINSIVKTGSTLKINKKIVVDKHSIGGIPGNRTTPIVVSICAAAGLTIPKNSSRAITSAAGTADVIETIAKVEFSIKDIKKIIKKTNGCMVWGGSLGLVPADEKIIRIEKMLKIDPEPQLLASILSKKIAAGSKIILIDIPYGEGAKVNKQKALALKRKFEVLGKYFKKKLKCVLTLGNQPIGNGVGPVLELIDVINVLNPEKKGPKDLEDKAIFLAGQILELAGKSKKGRGENLARQILYSGKAFKKFKEIIEAQGGRVINLKPSKINHSFVAKKSGTIFRIENKKINDLARVAGCPIDKFAGVFIHYHLNEKVKKGDKILTIYAETKSRLNEAIKYYKKIYPVIHIR